ncbi:hypothetical protein DC081_09155 [Ignatzschineria cameli]|uniref:YmfQ family protein n=1 Tax=Ignatzschineria cameli TaxID=2182793 RepID=UPI000D6205DF|nr:putative phage tail protein [Ignatzschineria cameli]PWD89606.1 hypothetical protein DC081_09155 [Ignatzschineria cameli]
MAMTDQNYKEVGIKLLPNGLAWNKSSGNVIKKLFSGLAKMWAEIDAEANRALNETNPQWSTLMLPEWEDLLGLPECNQTGQTIEERRDAAGYKWHLKGSLNPYFYMEWLAEAFGYEVTIVAYHQHHCLRACNYPLYTRREESRDDVYVYIKSKNPQRYFNVQDHANDPLRIGATNIVECILNKYKPAHVELMFQYEDEEV